MSVSLAQDNRVEFLKRAIQSAKDAKKEYLILIQREKDLGNLLDQEKVKLQALEQENRELEKELQKFNLDDVLDLGQVKRVEKIIDEFEKRSL